MKKAAQVTYRDGSTETAVIYPDTQVAFERAYERSFLDTFASPDGLFVEWVAFLAWFALPNDLTFETWLRTVTDVVLGYTETDEV